MFLELIFLFAHLESILQLLVGGFAFVKTLAVASWDWKEIEQAEFFEVDLLWVRYCSYKLFLPVFMVLKLVYSFSVILGAILHLLVGGLATVKTFTWPAETN